MRAVAVALLVEEQRGEIVAGWRGDVDRELGGEPALAFAVGPLLREMAFALRGDPSPLRPVSAGADAGARSAVLVRSGSPPARVAREFKLLHRALWQALKQAGAVVSADERRAGDEWLDEALAAALDRQDRVRARADLFEPASSPGAPAPARMAPQHAPEPRQQPGGPPPRTPPPLPRRAGSMPAPRAVPPVIAALPPPLPRRPASPTPLPVVETGVLELE